MFDNDNNMNIYGVNNNNSSLSTYSMREDVLGEILYILNKYRIKQEMKNNRNDGYYAILSQTIPNLY
jgi:hypothetical protein